MIRRRVSFGRHILRGKPFLTAVYRAWYASLLRQIEHCGQPILEIGSGAGFFKEHLPHLITSDIQHLPWVDAVLDATALPFADGSLGALVMINTFHHFSRPGVFLKEAARCVEPGGRVVMIEPWVTPWSRFMYRNFHHEPFEPDSEAWDLPRRGPLSTANGALPWILFARDHERFAAEHPAWEVGEVRLLNPLTYLLSGGVSLRPLAPTWSYTFWSRIENWLGPLYGVCALFARITLIRRHHAHASIPGS